MGLEKLIVNQVVKVAKNATKIQDTISSIENKLVEEGIKLVEESGINPSQLPFNLQSLAKGELDNPESILTPEVLCSIPPLTEAQKTIALRSITGLSNSINTIIDSTNQLKSALITIQQPLQTIEVAGNSLRNITTTVKAAIRVIKQIPIPVAFGAPAVALPIKVLTILSDSLDSLDKLITMSRGITTSIPILINGVLGIVAETIVGVNSIINKIEPALLLMTFIKAKIELGDSCPNITNGDIILIQNELTADINAAMLASGDSSIELANTLNEESLLSSLNGEPGLFYKGFKLTLESDPDNAFSFPKRRIKADRFFTNNENGTRFFSGGIKNQTPVLGSIVLYSDQLGAGRYSFSSSTQVLVEEMRYTIDQYLLGLDQQLFMEAVRDAGTPNITGSTSNTISLSSDNLTISSSLIPSFTLIGGTEVVGSLDSSRSDITGTITTTVDNVKLEMETFGGTGEDDYLNTIIRVWQPPKPGISFEQLALGGQMKNNGEIVMTDKGIYNYRMQVIGSGDLVENGSTANSTFSLKTP